MLFGISNRLCFVCHSRTISPLRFWKLKRKVRCLERSNVRIQTRYIFMPFATTHNASCYMTLKMYTGPEKVRSKKRQCTPGPRNGSRGVSGEEQSPAARQSDGGSECRAPRRPEGRVADGGPATVLWERLPQPRGRRQRRGASASVEGGSGPCRRVPRWARAGQGRGHQSQSRVAEGRRPGERNPQLTWGLADRLPDKQRPGGASVRLRAAAAEGDRRDRWRAEEGQGARPEGPPKNARRGLACSQRQPSRPSCGIPQRRSPRTSTTARSPQRPGERQRGRGGWRRKGGCARRGSGTGGKTRSIP